MENQELSQNKQGKIRVLSKIISILALIGRIAVYIAAPCIILTMIVIPMLLNKIDIKDNEIVVNDSDVIQIIEDDDSLTLKYKDQIVAVDEGKESLIMIRDMFQNNSKNYIVWSVEFGLTAALLLLALGHMQCWYLGKLFNNIHKEDTPFTLKNVSYIKKIAYYMIGLMLTPYLIEFIYGILFKQNINLNLNLANLTEILCLFVFAYIFEYGYEIQKNSKKRLYGKIDE